MSGNDGLYLGVALLGGAVLLSRSGSEDGITGGGLGETIREQIESVIAVPQTIKETTERIIQTGTDLTNGINNFIPDDLGFDGFAFDLSADSLQNSGNQAGIAAGGGLGGFLGGAFLGMYQGAAVAGAHFVGRDDVNMSNVNQKFMQSAGSLKDSVFSGASFAASTLAKGLVLGGDAGEAARLLSGSGGSGGSGTTSKGGTYIAKLKDGTKANIASGVSVSDFQKTYDNIASLKASVNSNRNSSNIRFDTKIRRAFS